MLGLSNIRPKIVNFCNVAPNKVCSFVYLFAQNFQFHQNVLHIR